MFKRKKIIAFILLLLIVVISKAQQDKVQAAYNSLQQKNLDSAKINIDEAVIHPETANSAEAWYLRGYVYKEIYKAKEKAIMQSPARMEALNSLKKVASLDTKQEYLQDTKQNIKYLVATLYNDAAESLDTTHYQTAILVFEKYKEYYPLVDTSTVNIHKKNVEFLLALGAVYNQLATTHSSQKELWNLEKSVYDKALAIDPNNVSANLNIGIWYYNQAVNIINQSEYDITLVALQDIQDNAINLFKQSLPFMEKAYNFDPKRKETLLGLRAIYWGLNEPEKSDMFKEKLKELEDKK